jgi:hypothetical protein
VQLDAPRHLYLHSTDSLKRLAAAAGFECEAVRYDSTAFQFWGSEQYVKNVPLHSPMSYCINPKESLFSKEDIEKFRVRAEELNSKDLGDQAAFYLRKDSLLA